VSIHQQALRGIALVALERGDKAAAMAQVRQGLAAAAAAGQARRAGREIGRHLIYWQVMMLAP
jgi:hypothetical protein